MRLFDLIKVKDNKFLNVFYFATKDTLVCEGMNVGTKVAYESVPGKTFRVVTLEGQMIETSGMMSGGGNPKRGLMSHKIAEEFSPDQIKEIETRIQQLEQEVQKLKADSDKLE